MVLSATLLFCFRIDADRQRASEYSGKHTVTACVTEVVYISENSSAFNVKIEQIGFDKVSFKARLICMLAADLSVGDTLRGQAELTAFGKNNSSSGILLNAVLYSSDTAEVIKLDTEQPFFELLLEKNGWRVVVENIKRYISGRADLLLGDKVGGLAKGFLLGERSDISTDTLRDFRRTGLSHVFAVSGMHISLLLGAIDRLLSKLFVHKYVRCSIITLMCIPLLMLTGFSMSAVRSVLMLWTVYMFLVFKEMADGVTTLFCSVSAILLIFPYSVYDIGLWMSFLATLGLLTLLPYFVRIIRRSKCKRVLVRCLINSARELLLAVLMTAICSMFLLPVQWYVFGEISVVSLIANVPIYFLSGIFMVGTVLLLLFGSVPVLGYLLSLSVGAVGNIMMGIAKFLAGFDFATVSLKYFFADILVILFAASFTVLLAVQLKRRWLVFAPFVGFCLCFGLCIFMYNITDNGKMTYYNEYDREILTVTDNGHLAIIDTSSSSYGQYERAFEDAYSSGATCVDKIIFTQITRGRISAVEYFMQKNLVKAVYIPTPKDEEELALSYELSALARSCSVSVCIYDGSQAIAHQNARIYIERCENDGEKATAVFVSANGKIHSYADARAFGSNRRDALENAFALSDTVIAGGRNMPSEPYSCTFEGDTSLIYSSEAIWLKSKIVGTDKCFINRGDSFCLPLRFK